MDWDFSVEHHIEVWESKEAHNLGNQMSEKGMHTRSCETFNENMKLKNNDDRNNELKSQSVGAGKGDKPRPITKKYWDNYDEIDWSFNKSEYKIKGK
jgi:hypothetical protein